MAETLTIRTASSTEVVKIASVGPQGPKGDKGDPGDVAGLPLTTLGDTLYRGASENQRLPIGTSGQILKVSTGGIPEWGAAPATGVTSVALASSDLTITGSPITSSGTITANVAVNALTLNKLEQISTAHFLGRHSAHGGDVQPVSATQARTILNVADGAEANVQSNWTEADSGSDAFILNKPTLGNSAALNVGTTAGTVAAGDDARLSDSRTPTAHAASHAAGGSDPLELVNLAATGTGEGELAVSQGDGTVAWQNGTTWAGLNITAIDVGAAADDHTHGNLTNDGKVGSTSGLPLKTGTAGVVEAGSFGTSAGTFAEGNHGHDISAISIGDPQGFLEDLGGVVSGSITSSGLTQSTARILGRTDASNGPVQEITIGSGLSLSAGELSSTVSAGIPATLLDAKGDLIVASAADTASRLPIGATNGHALVVDSAEALGMKWAAVTSATMTGASNSTAGAAGLVPQPAAASQGDFLAGDATFKKTWGSHWASSTRFGTVFHVANPLVPTGVNTTFTVDYAYYCPIVIPLRMTIDGYFAFSQRSTASQTLYFALYTNASESPDALVANSAASVTDPTHTTGIKVAIGSNIVLEQGKYWIAVSFQSSGQHQAANNIAPFGCSIMGGSINQTSGVLRSTSTVTHGTWANPAAARGISTAQRFIPYVGLTIV